jgi:hypothetical protein
VNKETYSDTVHRLRDAVRNMQNQQLVSTSRQCSSSPVCFGSGFLSKDECNSTGASPILPDLAPAEFYLLLRLKSASKGRCFCADTDIIKNATEELKRLSQNGPRKVSNIVHSCTGGQFWRKCSLNDLRSCISQKLTDSGDTLKPPRVQFMGENV